MLRSLAGLQLTDEDGEVHVLELRPPATDGEIRRLEESLPAPLPEEIRAALGVTTGLASGPLESFSLLDLEGFGLEEAFPQAYSIAHDGYGNFWVLDLLPGDGAWGPVLYACHDPPVIAYQAETIETFLRDVVAMWRPGRSSVDRMHEEEVHRIWHDHPGLLTPASASSSDDPVLAGFAAGLPAEARIADLRRARFGDGFAWGRFGPRTEIRRAGGERLWALIPPPPKPGLLRRLFGRSALTISACVLLAACDRGDRAHNGTPGSSAPAAASAESPPSGSMASPATTAGIPLRDPVQLTATADVDGDRYQFSGLGECQHTSDASIYEVPASMWSARFSDTAGTFTYLNLTLWQPKGAAAIQVSLGLTGAGKTSEIATVKGSQLRGSGTGRTEPNGEGGALIVDGRDASGHAVRLTVHCTRFTEPVAEGG